LREFKAPNICGIDCKNEDIFLLIEQELDKENSVTQNESTNWNFVISSCEELLSNRTKDLKIATWWLFAKYKLQSINGLLYGLNTYISLIEIFMVDIFPISRKSRTNILNWLEINLSNQILKNEDNLKSIKNNKEINSLFKHLDKVIKNMTNEDKNNFKKIILISEPKEDENIITEVLKPQDKVEPQRELILEKTSIQEFVNEINSDSDAIKILRNLKKNASLLADFYRKKNFSDLRALRITRFLSWFDIEGLPFSNGKKTSLYPPSDTDLDLLGELFKNKKYDETLYLVEEILEVCPFWFDGHYYAFNVLEETNNFNSANEIKNSFISFIKSNEGILNLYFINDTPFASVKTKKWIESEIIQNDEIKLETNEKEKTEIDNFIKEVHKLAEIGKIKEAIEMFQIKHSISSNMEEKFNWRLKQSEFSIEYEKKEIALALLEELEKDVDKYNLIEWNPKLASKVYFLMLNNFTNLDIHIDKINLIYKNLCKTDVNSAFEIKI